MQNFAILNFIPSFIQLDSTDLEDPIFQVKYPQDPNMKLLES